MTATEKEKIIQGYIKSLEISRTEAEQLFEDDYSDVILPEVEEMTAKAKTLKMYVEGEKTHNKGKNKVRKVDNEKLEILQLLEKTLLNNSCQKTKIEKEVNLHFIMNGNEYTLKLIKHRPIKNKKS